jgi:hypothetical protein
MIPNKFHGIQPLVTNDERVQYIIILIIIIIIIIIITIIIRLRILSAMMLRNENNRTIWNLYYTVY